MSLSIDGNSVDDELKEEEEEEEDYETARQKIISQNNALLASLGLPQAKPYVNSTSSAGNDRNKNKKASKPIKRIVKIQVEPTRRSSRVASKGVAGALSETSLQIPLSQPARKPLLPSARTPILPPGPIYEQGDEEIYEDRPVPSRDENGTLIFEGRWKGVFTPNLTPLEMFQGGAFGGAFYCDTYSKTLSKPLSASKSLSNLPFPVRPELIPKLTASEPDPELNRYKVKAGQSLQDWEKAGWIWAGDPRGWAEWFVRFWGGRRCEDDERQVKRWLNLAGPNGRFKRALLKRIQLSGGRGVVEDEDVGRTLRQCLWQWGYELKLSDWDEAMG